MDAWVNVHIDDVAGCGACCEVDAISDIPEMGIPAEIYESFNENYRDFLPVLQEVADKYKQLPEEVEEPTVLIIQ